MRKHFQYAASMGWSVLIAGALTGCQSGAGTIEVALASSGQPLLALGSAADAGSATPVDAGAVASHLVLTVTRVEVHVAGLDGPDDDPPAGPPGAPVMNGDDGGWITVFSGTASVDLLKAASVEIFLGSTVAPAGKITQIRLVLSDATWVDGAVLLPVACPSCNETGLKIVTMGKLFVPVGGTLHVTLDFDQEHSLQASADGYRLDPVVKIARTDTH
jgi:hypothetical protein